NLVMLLPHGQEGQGPEHSSARLERFLILCAQDNMFVCNPTTPAQYFHLLRRQMLNQKEMPLVVMSPKSLLRLPDARSEIKEFTDGRFYEIIDDSSVKDKGSIKRINLTSGKVYYDLLKYKTINNIDDTALVRVEQYYPYNLEEVTKIISSYPNAKIVNWVQEEPQNMGAWNFMYSRLLKNISAKQKLFYVGRVENPSPASGTHKSHEKTQEELVKKAFE
ncbi:MAG: multifunctional oxoglutarate decarboxylase/oxoglutarate dehydrogenase thiamine pyrophosphate-binding subunit/dihydrolipoyllysine-residue succinyltransferase subunit, partial [Melioribacteraceae bacterium]